MIRELNKDQLDGLATLCFDLAKVSFISAFLPGLSFVSNPLESFFKIVLGLIWGIACTYVALVLLKLKEGGLK